MFTSHWNSLIFHTYLSISALDPINYNNAFSLVGWVSNGFLLIKDQHTWLVIVKNGNSGDCISSMESCIGTFIV